MPGAVKGSRQHRMTVVPHRPWQRAAIALSGLLVLVMALVLMYRIGFERGADNLAELNLAHSQGMSDVQRAARQLAELRAALSVAERNRQLDEQVNAQAQASIAALRSKMAVLERDVALYRQVMALEAQAPSLSVRSWQLAPTELPDHFRYRLTLAYTGANDTAISGQLNIIIGGESAPDEPQGADVRAEPLIRVSEPVSLRYLQVIEGDVQIPAGFTANHVKLEFNADSSSTLAFSETRPWQPEGDI